MVQLLLAASALVDCRTRDGLTPLHCAARSGHADLASLLIDAGANPSAKTRVRLIVFRKFFNCIFLFSLFFLLLLRTSWYHFARECVVYHQSVRSILFFVHSNTNRHSCHDLSECGWSRNGFDCLLRNHTFCQLTWSIWPSDQSRKAFVTAHHQDS